MAVHTNVPHKKPDLGYASASKCHTKHICVGKYTNKGLEKPSQARELAALNAFKACL